MVNGGNNGVGNGHFEHVEGEVDALQTYRRRPGRPRKHQTKHQKQEYQDTAAAAARENGLDYDSRNLVLKSIHSQLPDAQGGIEGCLCKALKLPPLSSKDLFSDKAPMPSFDVNQLCQQAFFTVIQNDKFASFCKLLLDNFNGINPHAFFEYNLLHTKIKEGFYEHHPALFSTDLQKVWRKAQMVGTEMISLSESLLNISKASCSERIRTPDGVITKEEQVEAQTFEQKANGEDCSKCNEMYHENCVACISLKARATLDNGVKGTDSTDSQMSAESGQSNDDNEKSYLCKMCETDTRNCRSIRICSHFLCERKFYHVRCLTKKQLKSYSQRWYCPSCLCRVCLNDKDDPKIMLCDGCDYAYHTYCVQPPLDSVPEGAWFCKKCDDGMKEIRKRKRVYTSAQDGNNHGILGKDEGVDMLLNAANTLNVEEKCASIST